MDGGRGEWTAAGWWTPGVLRAADRCLELLHSLPGVLNLLCDGLTQLTSALHTLTGVLAHIQRQAVETLRGAEESADLIARSTHTISGRRQH